MGKTRGDLQPATIEQLAGGLCVECMFNPFEYTITKSNTYRPENKNQSDVPHYVFEQAGAQTLSLNLTFDTYEQRGNVTDETSKLFEMMRPTVKNQAGKLEPSAVAFTWGPFQFEAVIKQVTQKFTLFEKNGTPVRAQVSVSFQQHIDPKDYPGTNPTSGGGAVERIWRVVAGDRLDTIAAKVYGDASKWRLIAEYNQIENPLTIRAGQALTIPSV